MAIFGGGKKPEDGPTPEINVPEPATPVDGDSTGGLADLTSRLGSLQETLQQTESQVAGIVAKHAEQSARSTDDRLDQIVKRLDDISQKCGGGAVAPAPNGESAGSSMDSQVLGVMLQKLGQLEEAVRSGGPAPAATAADAETKPAGDSSAASADLGPLLQQLRDGLAQQFDGVISGVNQAQQQLQQHVNGGLNQVYQHLDAKLSEIITILRPPQPDVQEQKSVGDDADWQVAIFGPEMSADPVLENYRRHLLEGMITGDEGARTFAGQLLVFRSARTDALPQMLKLLGEAFYTWLPKTTQDPNPMEQALVRWVNDYCYNAGIGNTIEVITPGERFDNQRHTSTNRSGGVEIQCVRGWVVVREGGRVYTKATVDVV